MPTLNDGVMSSLSLYSGTANDRLRQAISASIAVPFTGDRTLDELWAIYLAEWGYTTGTLQERIWAWMNSRISPDGTTYNDTQYAFWNQGGTFPPFPGALSIFDFRSKLTALPPLLTALSATYTRASQKRVVQDGALVTLSSNQFGTTYDSVTGLYGYMPEPAATNLATNSDGAASTYTVSNVTDGTAVPGFTNGLAFGDNSVQRSSTKAISVTSGTVYSISFFVIMDDGNAPVVGTTNTTGDFSIALNSVIATTKLERLIGSNVYRVSASITASATASHAAGIIKYTGQSVRTFRATGIQVETGARATSYIPTTGSTATRAADVLTVPLYKNTLLYSSNFGAGTPWAKVNVSVGAVQPDGSTLFTRTSAVSSCYAQYSSTSTIQGVPVGGKVYARIKCKAATTGNYFAFRVQGTYPNRVDVVVNLSTGAIAFQAGSTYSIDSATVSGPDADGFYTLAIIATTATSVMTSIFFGPTAVTTAAWEAASATLSDCYVKEAQVFLGGAAQEFIATSGSLGVAGNANIPGFSAAGYTLFADGRQDVTEPGVIRRRLQIDGGSSNNRAILSANNGSSQVSVAVVSGGSAHVGTVAGSASIAREKLVLSCAVNSFIGALNGVAIPPDTTGAMPVSPTTLRLGVNNSGSEQANGALFRVGIVPRALTQAQLNGMTA